MKIDPNAPAYPTDSESQVGHTTWHHSGMTIRAALAMTALPAVYAANVAQGGSDQEAIVAETVDLADALIAALNKDAP